MNPDTRLEPTRCGSVRVAPEKVSTRPNRSRTCHVASARQSA
jgi:hypothetical protein